MKGIQISPYYLCRPSEHLHLCEMKVIAFFKNRNGHLLERVGEGESEGSVLK